MNYLDQIIKQRFFINTIRIRHLNYIIIINNEIELSQSNSKESKPN